MQTSENRINKTKFEFILIFYQCVRQESLPFHACITCLSNQRKRKPEKIQTAFSEKVVSVGQKKKVFSFIH